MTKHYLKPLFLFLISALISACGGGNATEAPFKVTNTAPEISSFESNYQLRENNSVIIENMKVSDAQNDSLTVKFTGEDADIFSYDLETGKLVFKLAPDYEAPQDSDKNNIYVVELVVSDAELSTMVTLDVKVINDIAIEIISPINDSNIGGDFTYRVLAKINDMESDDLGYLNSAEVLINGNAANSLDESNLYWILELETSTNNIKAELLFDGAIYVDDIDVKGIHPLFSVQNIVIDEEEDTLYVGHRYLKAS